MTFVPSGELHDLPPEDKGYLQEPPMGTDQVELEEPEHPPVVPQPTAMEFDDHR